jgi:hypothetical protein
MATPQKETARCVAQSGPLIREKCSDVNDQSTRGSPRRDSVMGAMRDVMRMNIARRFRAVGTKCSRSAKAFFAAPGPRPRPTAYRCSPTSSGSSVDSAIALTGLPLARLYAYTT